MQRIAVVWLLSIFPLSAQWIAYYDYEPGFFTHSNTATFTGVSGSVSLKNITNGASVGVTVTVANSGAVQGAVQGTPDYGSPASYLFDGYVDFFGDTTPGIELDTATDFVTYTFSGLNPAFEYNFEGTALRGNIAYVNRWSLFEIQGAQSFTSRHPAGALTTAEVPALTAAQVAINTGYNSAGVVAWWEHIKPAANGTFTVKCTWYQGTVPGGSSAGAKGYGITGFRLEPAPTYTGPTNLPPRTANSEGAEINGVSTVFLIMMENHDWNTILGAAEAPYINSALLPRASYCDQYFSSHAIHPSEPNYLWIVAGTNFGIRDDNTPANNHQSSTKTIFNQLDAAGISWKSYQEDISGTTVPDADNGNYAVRHNPPVFFDWCRNNLIYCTNHVRPYSELPRDLTNNTVPRFCFITPNLTNDMHNAPCTGCSSRTAGDDWLSHEVPKILASAAYTNGGALIITWDEGSSEGDGPFGMIVLSARAKGGGYHNSIYYTHSSLLRTLQDIFHVRPYLGDAAYARSLADLFKTIQFTSFSATSNVVRLEATNLIAGKTNYVQVSTNLSTTNWIALRTNIAATTSLSFTNGPVGGDRFYRVVELP